MKFQFSVVKIVLLLLACCVTGLVATAQQTHFMYIQSDNKAPFYVVLDKKTYNSNGTGYLIVSKIAKGEHTFNLGFPDNKYPVQSFKVALSDADAGYALKNYGEKGWGLFNLQSMAVVMGKPVSGGQTAVVKEKTPAPATVPATTTAPATNMFGDMLSEVVGDPNLQQKQVQPAKQPVKKPEPVKDTVEVAVAEVPEDAMDNAATRGVIKAGEKAGKEGVGYTFIDFNNKGTDTVKIFIPAAGEVSGTVVMVDSAVAVNVTDVTVADTTVKEETREDKRAARKKKKNDPEFVETTIAADTAVASSGVSNPFYTKPATAETTEKAATTRTETATAEPVKEPVAKEGASAAVSYNSNCSGGMAVDKDLDKLKKKMVGEEGDDKMIAVAKKGFKSKCYTTEQIKELGRLFYTDESRYAFYDAAYPFVYDISNFISLEKMLLDDYYKKRFRAMLRM